MAKEKSPFSGNTSMLILKLLEKKDMYGYQIIEELARQSQNIFQLKTGTLYPILHTLEKDGMVISYEQSTGQARVRRYYQITAKGKGLLCEKQSEWDAYADAVKRILDGGAGYAFA